MAIVKWPDDVPTEATVHCAICGAAALPTVSSAGRHYANGRQAFACNTHSWDLARLINGWVNFAIDQNYQNDSYDDMASSGREPGER